MECVCSNGEKIVMERRGGGGGEEKRLFLFLWALNRNLMS